MPVCACLRLCAILVCSPGTQQVSKGEIQFQLVFRFVFCAALSAALYLYHTKSFSRGGSHGTPVALQGLLLISATNGASVCTCVCVCALCACVRRCVILNTRWTTPTRTSLKSTCAVQRWYNSSSSGTESANPAQTHKHRKACVSTFQFATPPGFQVNRIPKGDLVSTCIGINLTFSRNT